MPFDVYISNVSDPGLGPLLTALDEAGYPDPLVTPVRSGALSGADASSQPPEDDLPTEWAKVRELADQTYRWPAEEERYDPYVIYAGKTDREGTVHIALGDAGRANVWGKDRKYVIAFLTSGAPQIPLVEFLETDDYGQTGEMLAIIRGRDGAGSRKMFGPSDPLPDVYAHFRTEMYSDLVRGPGTWRKVAVVAHENDADTMLSHALVQARRRGDL